MSVCELLGLRAEDVAAQADAYRGYAQALVNHENSHQNSSMPAHYMAISAGYSAAADPRMAREVFGVAAEMAMQEAKSFEEKPRAADDASTWRRAAAMLGACGSDSSWAYELVEADVSNRTIPLDGYLPTILVLLKAGTAHRDRAHTRKALSIIAERANSFGPVPVGILQIPLSFALRLIRLVLSSTAEPLEREWWNWGFSFGRRLQERVSLAQLDSFHWERLYSRLLPIEPEGLLATGVWREMMESHKLDTHWQDKRFRELPPAMQAYLEAARQIFSNAPPAEQDRAA
jgi:hypothetical protein